MIHRWSIVTIGNLSRNRYWGEGDEQPVRPALCTCTLIDGHGSQLLVDPSLADRQKMETELDRRTGLQLGEISAVFITHAHGDHHAGLMHFPDAAWLAAPGVAEAINKTGKYAKAVMPAAGQIVDGVDLVPTPGHTTDHHSLRFDWNGHSIVVAGDAVMTWDFWRHRQGYFNSVDLEQVTRTMDDLASIADIIVPGHDNYFLT
jgi:glyoxylase-like metal-dependent hydrolase (beta-lactamase superfamily II)